MDKEHLLYTLDNNVTTLNDLIALHPGYDPDSLETLSFLAGAADAYSIVAESIRNGDFAVRNGDDPLMLF